MTLPYVLQDFLFDVPENLIAQQPLARRDESRLLWRDKSGELLDRGVAELAQLVPPNSLLVFNSSKVIPGRILFQLPTGGKAELMLLHPAEVHAESCSWRAMGKPLRRLKSLGQLHLADGLTATVAPDAPAMAMDERSFLINFNCSQQDLLAWLDRHGFIPLPPYITRNSVKPAAASADRERYQTVYAKTAGSVAAPTAGLHFSEELLQALRQAGIESVEITLHVGAGTFLPVQSENIDEHIMHSEAYTLSAHSLRQIEGAIATGRPIIAIGTTSFRCVESFYGIYREDGERMRAAESWHNTNLFVRPRQASDRFVPQVFSALFTNFHQPGSTLFMLVAALIGLKEAKAMYAEAIRRHYRFFSYGDATMLWLRN